MMKFVWRSGAWQCEMWFLIRIQKLSDRYIHSSVCIVLSPLYSQSGRSILGRTFEAPHRFLLLYISTLSAVLY